ncbi:MAG: transketolase [Candidatus Hinthialibacter antarcticus]|nr:transketolase [Candidatus Hinthialibacter antarcticus]
MDNPVVDQVDNQLICHQIRQNILRVSHHSGHGHIPTCFSIVESLVAVYNEMRHDSDNPDWNHRDIFILSKGHASLALYCTLAQFGYFSIDEVFTFGAHRSKFGCHPDRLKIPGVEASTGSLGHGISLAVGMALAMKIQKTSRRVFTLIGDGESNEGTVWESLLVASDLELNNLTVLFDFNHSQSRSLQISNPEEKFHAFGCDALTVDGHDVQSVIKTIQRPSSQPKVIVTKTRKGNGCSTLENNMFEWHRKSPNEEQLAQLLTELNQSQS